MATGSSMFDLDTSTLTSSVGGVFSGFGPVIILVAGIGLAFVAVPKVMKWIKKGAK